MLGRPRALPICLDEQTRLSLRHWMLRPKTPAGVARRTRAILLLEQGKTYVETATRVGLSEYHLRKWARRFLEQGAAGLMGKPRPGCVPVFSPEIALYVVKLACERADAAGCSLSHWDCPELARRLTADEIVSSISPATVWRILNSHKLKPWRYHLWLSAKVPRDTSFARLVQSLIELYTRPLPVREVVLSVNEKTSIQPRPRKAPTLPPRSGQPLRLELEYQRGGAVHLFAAFDIRSGKVYARTEQRKRQAEFIAFLSQLDRNIPASITSISLVLDNSSVHKGKQVQTWIQAHPRFVCFFLPVHCSWMNQIEQWFSIVQRKRLRISDFADLGQLADRLMSFVAEWNAHAHPFNMNYRQFLFPRHDILSSSRLTSVKTHKRAFCNFIACVLG